MAKAKNKGKGPKPGKKKISLLKLSNKKLNKLAKQGKLKKAVGKKRLVNLLKERTSNKKLDRKSAPETEEPIVESDIPLQEADYEYFAKPGRNFEFLSDLVINESNKKSSRRKRKLKESSNNDANDYSLNEGLYEKRTSDYSTNNNNNVKQLKQLLPFKSKDKGIIHRTVEIEEEPDGSMEEDSDINDDDDNNNVENGYYDDGDVDHDDNHDNNNTTPHHPAIVTEQRSEIERYIDKKIESSRLKKTISNLCISVLQSMDEHIGTLSQILEYLSDDYTTFIRKYAMVSLLEVFKDIIPDYKIRAITEVEKKQKMKKETKSLFGTEETLLTNYKKYIDALDVLSKGQVYSVGKKRGGGGGGGGGSGGGGSGGSGGGGGGSGGGGGGGSGSGGVSEEKKLKIKKSLRRKSVECLGELLTSHPQFNFRVDVIAIIIRSMFNHDSKTSDLACEAIKKLFSQDRIGEVTLEVVRLIGRAIKVRKFEVKPKVLNTFLSLKIKEISMDGEGANEKKKKMTMEERRKIGGMMSRRDKKRQKQMKCLERELEEAAVTENNRQKMKMHTEIISMVFLTYFRVLKLSTGSQLLPSVLEGLAKFAHLINISYFDDLFGVLTKLVDSGDLNTIECLHCIQTALTLLMGQGSAFNIDPFKFYARLYKALLSFNFKNTTTDLPPCLCCLDLMVNKRKRHVSDQRCLAFVKRLSILSLQLHPAGAVPVLSVIRDVIRNYPKCDALLDTECIGSGHYLPELDNPDHCNAQETSLFELHLLRSSYDPDIRMYAQHLIHSSPRDGPFRLPVHLSRISSTELFNPDFSRVLRELEEVNELRPRPTFKSGSIGVSGKKKKSFFKKRKVI